MINVGRSADDRWGGLDTVNRIIRVAMVLCLLLCFAAPAFAAPGTVEEIRINGLFRMTRAGFLHALGVEVGDPFDAEQIRIKYREIWDLKLFEDLSFYAEAAPEGGVALVVVVVERPVLSSVEYKDNKSVNRTEIEDALGEKDVRLDLGRPIDNADLAEVAAVIRDILAQKGHTDPTVEYTLEDVTETSRAVTYRIVPGPKTRIRKIKFRGNERFGSRTLAKQLELTDVYKWYWPWSKKTLYHPLKWDQDSGRIRDLYKAFGYLDSTLR